MPAVLQIYSNFYFTPIPSTVAHYCNMALLNVKIIMGATAIITFGYIFLSFQICDTVLNTYNSG